MLNSVPSSSSDPFSCDGGADNGSNSKRKRRPAGTPDPDAEVVSLSPKTLLESDRYVCEICNQGFQRDQNLQMHRRRHKVPWKLLKRETPIVRKRVFVCPEPSCLHHDPCHALGDLVGIKKHFRRKHSNIKQWVCEKCSKGYAVQSDYKAHLKTCGTRGHSCDCGRVFSRVESFIEHQDACNMGRIRSESHSLPASAAACLSRTASSPSPSTETNLSAAAPPWPPLLMPKPIHTNFLITPKNKSSSNRGEQSRDSNLELQLLTTSSPVDLSTFKRDEEYHSTQLQLSIGSSDFSDKNELEISNININATMGCSRRHHDQEEEANIRDELRAAMAEKAYAEEARKQAKRQIELAEAEFVNAKRIRQQAQAELEKAVAFKQLSAKKINATILEITCHTCKDKFQASAARTTSSSLTVGEVVGKGDRFLHPKFTLC
ncbi:hypothetical protein M9H77_14375 [Catharanthus roseus]|uniref:Uncharacterized protein n=1 Tax=Catharanthus roseus TaxID=4058 RepID=A0ACC0BMV3_CATRO|nr:hypothetical protein M9H77_14375 [Catharanthus roseus]